MQFIELDECHSTQEYLKNQLSEGSLKAPVLVSAKKQTKGKGRRGNPWFQFENSLAFSFTCKPFDPLTISPLAIGVEVCEIFKSLGFDLKLKWPNDILDIEGNKVGGILCEVFDEKIILVGVGINLFSQQGSSFDYPHSFVLKEKKIFDKENFFEELSEKIKKNNFDYLEKWNSYCFHLNKEVIIKDDKETTNGFFVGLGENGEALIESVSKGVQRVFTGSLRLLEGDNKS